MSISGPPKKPTRLKVIEGTFRADRAVTNEAQPEIALPQPPEHLSEGALLEWNRIAHELFTIGLLSRIDRAALAAYCEAWSDWVDACRLCVTKDGQDRKVIKTAMGNFIENPYYTIKKRSAEIMHKFLTEFGMTPASRARIDIDAADVAKDDPADRYLA